MGLLDDLATIDGRRYSTNAVDRMLDEMDEQHRAATVAALRGPMSHAELGRKLQKHGYLDGIKDAGQRIAEWRRSNRGDDAS